MHRGAAFEVVDSSGVEVSDCVFEQVTPPPPPPPPPPLQRLEHAREER
eukprot:COSAG03_NODE_6796_length_1004_cov_5.861878_3_plen_47_part_01